MNIICWMKGNQMGLIQYNLKRLNNHDHDLRLRLGLLIFGIVTALPFIASGAVLSETGRRVPPPASETEEAFTSAKEVSANVKKSVIVRKGAKQAWLRVWDFQNPNSKVLPEFWQPISGEWKLATEPEHPGNTVVYQSDIKRNFQILESQESFGNFQFSAKMRTDSFEQKTRNWHVGIIFRQAGDKYYYKFRLTAGNLALLRCSARNLTQAGATGTTRAASVTGRYGKEDEELLLILPQGGQADRWYNLSVSCYGERIILKLDGREIRLVRDNVIGSGKIGVFTYKTRAFFDDMRLIYLPLPEKITGIVLNRNDFYPRDDREILLGYNLPSAKNVSVQILAPDNKMFFLLYQGFQAPGFNSLTWDGHGLLGRPAPAGSYTIDVKAEDFHKKISIQIIE